MIPSEIDLVSLRRQFHRYPELGFQEYQTQKFIVEYFSGRKIEIQTVGTGVLIFIRAGGNTILGFRCEEDALPLQEQTDLPFRSEIGAMHACGHDGHMAMVMKLGDYILEHREELKNDYLLIFEPGEELSGGSRMIVESAFYRMHRPAYVFALHVYPCSQEGAIYLRAGPFLAKCVEINIEIYGKASHVAAKEQGKDALAQGISILREISAYLNAQRRMRFLFGRMHAGSQRNIVADYCTIEGTIRVFSDRQYEAIKKGIASIFEHSGVDSYRVSYNDDFFVVDNDRETYEKIKKVHPVLRHAPLFIGESFGCYQQNSKTCYALLGIHSSPLHSADFCFDEAVLSKGLAYFIGLLNLT